MQRYLLIILNNSTFLQVNQTINYLKHYYNFDIQGGYDARVKREALIKINGEDYRTGFMSLNSVSMKNQLPHAYKVVFYGKTVNLKRLFGDDELSILGGFSGAYLSAVQPHLYICICAKCV